MLRFKQFLIEYSFIIEDKANDFANRYMKIHGEHEFVKNNPEEARELFKKAMAYTQGSDEAEFLTRQFLQGTLKPGEDDVSIRQSLGQWRKAGQRNLTKGKSIKGFNYDELIDFLGQYPELKVSKSVTRAAGEFEPYKIGEMDLPGDVDTLDATGKPVKLPKGKKVQVHRFVTGDADTPEDASKISKLRAQLKKACPPGSSWCVLNDDQYLKNYSKGHGFFFYTDESGLPVFAHGYGDRGVVDPENRVLKRSTEVMRSTNPLISDHRGRVLHKGQADMDLTPDEIQKTLDDPDPNFRKVIARQKYGSLSDEVIDRIMADKDPEVVRSFVYGKGNLREKDVKTLLQSSDPSKRGWGIDVSTGSGNMDRMFSADIESRRRNPWRGQAPDLIDDEMFEKLLKDQAIENRGALASRELRLGNRYDRIQKLIDASERDAERYISATELPRHVADPAHFTISDDPTAVEVRKRIYPHLHQQDQLTALRKEKNAETLQHILDTYIKKKKTGKINELVSVAKNENISDEIFDQLFPQLTDDMDDADKSFIRDTYSSLSDDEIAKRIKEYEAATSAMRGHYQSPTELKRLRRIHDRVSGRTLSPLTPKAQSTAPEISTEPTKNTSTTSSISTKPPKVTPLKGRDVTAKVATTLLDPTQPVVDATFAQVIKAAPKLGKTDILPASRSRIPGPRPVATSIGYGLAGIAGGLAGQYLVEPAAEKAGVFNAVERGTRAALSKMPDWAADVADKGFGAAQVALDPLSAMAPIFQQGLETKTKQEVDAAIKAGKPSQVRFRGSKY